MQKVASNHRLLRRGTVWYYRRRVTQNLRSYFARDMVMVSLQTSDRKEAAALRTIRDLEWDAKFAAAETKFPKPTGSADAAVPLTRVVITSEAALQMVPAYVERTDKVRSEQWAADPPRDAEERRELEANLLQELAIAQARAPGFNHVEYFSQTWAKIFGSNAEVVDAAQRATVQDLVRRACIEIERRALARNQDDLSRRYFDTLFDQGRPKSVTIRQLAEGSSL